MNHIFKRVLLRVLPRVWTWAPHSREPLTDFDSIFCGRDVFAMFAELCFAGSWALIMSSVYAGSFVSATKIQKYTAQLLTPQALLRPATSSNMPIDWLTSNWGASETSCSWVWNLTLIQLWSASLQFWIVQWFSPWRCVALRTLVLAASAWGSMLHGRIAAFGAQGLSVLASNSRTIPNSANLVSTKVVPWD